MKIRNNDYSIQIKTSKGQKIIIDPDDFEKCAKYSWCISKTGYAVANIRGKVTKMHRYILGIKDPNIVIDHINRNPLDNRKENLRLCTPRENSRNTSVSKNNKTKCLGISIVKKTGKYRARIMVNGKEINLGRYDNIEDAKKVRKEAEMKYFKEFAPINT